MPSGSRPKIDYSDSDSEHNFKKSRARDFRRDSDQRIIVSTSNAISLKRVVTSDDSDDQQTVSKKDERKVSITRVYPNDRRRHSSSEGEYRHSSRRGRDERNSKDYSRYDRYEESSRRRYGTSHSSRASPRSKHNKSGIQFGRVHSPDHRRSRSRTRSRSLDRKRPRRSYSPEKRKKYKDNYDEFENARIRGLMRSKNNSPRSDSVDSFESRPKKKKNKKGKKKKKKKKKYSDDDEDPQSPKKTFSPPRVEPPVSRSASIHESPPEITPEKVVSRVQAIDEVAKDSVETDGEIHDDGGEVAPDVTPTIDEKPHVDSSLEEKKQNGTKDEMKYTIDKTIPVYKPEHETDEAERKSLIELPMPSVPSPSDAENDRLRRMEKDKSTPKVHSKRKEEKAKKSKSLLDMPLPKPIVEASLAQTQPIKKPKICGPRAHEYSESSDEWGSLSVEKYELGDVIGEGTFGQVFKATEKRTNKIVALKKVRLEKEKEGFPVTTVREIKILRQLNEHQNIIKLREIVSDKLIIDEYKKWKGAFYLVFDYMDHDLMGVLESGLVTLEEDHIKLFMYQLMDGLNYCHQKNFLHRDIKCSNILLNNKGEIKLADFGLARLYDPKDKRPYTNRVITLWYRSPELLLGEETYTTSVDIWSCGCVLGELFMKKPLFQADREPLQLEAISRVCGTPSPALWPEVIDLRFFHTIKPKKNYRRRLREEFQNFPPKALDLLDAMLTLDPKRRITAADSLKCDWLKNFDKTKVVPPDLPKYQDCHFMWSKKKRRGERQNQSDTNSSNHDYLMCKRFLEKNPNMTVGQLAVYSSTELEQLNTDDISKITVKDIFHVLETKNDPGNFAELVKVILSVAQTMET